MFDWREFLLRNQNQPAQIDRTTLKLLEEQLLQLLPPIVNALNATNILPLEPTWSKNEIAQKFKIILEVVEQRYLVAWDHVSNGQIQKLQADYQTWYQSQLRSEKISLQNLLSVAGIANSAASSRLVFLDYTRLERASISCQGIEEEGILDTRDRTLVGRVFSLCKASAPNRR